VTQPPGRRRAALCLLICALGCSGTRAGAQVSADQPATAPLPTRPRVGLVLAGGGAKGGAHVGVLKVLEEMHVPIDCIAGTSIGAVVGGGYAAGMSASDIERFVRGIDWKAVVGGAGDRKLEPAEQKRAEAEAGSRLEFALKDRRIVAPTGLIPSANIEALLRSYVAQARTISSFDELPIPYRAVATDMLKGDMVVLGTGDLATAMRASMAIPGAFSPVYSGSYVLSDGGLVRNLPVDVARNLCADVVIAVNLVSPPVKPDQLLGAGRLAARSMEVMLGANEVLQLQSLTARDVRIDVQVGDIAVADFERTPESIPLGEAAARKMAAQLTALAVPAREYAAWRTQVATRQRIDTRVAGVRFEGTQRINPQFLESLTRIRAGDRVNNDALSADARRMAVVQEVESVNYDLSGDPANPVLVWHVQEKQLGPDYVIPTLGLYFGGGGDTDFVLAIQYSRRWVNALGAEWRTTAQIGDTALLDTSFYQPLSASQRFFVQPDFFLSRSIEDIYNDYQRVATYRFGDIGLVLAAGTNLSLFTQLRLGYWFDRRRLSVDTGPPVLPVLTTTDAGLQGQWTYDSREASSFAREGMAAEVEYLGSTESLGAKRDWQRAEAAFRKSISLGKLDLWLTAAGGTKLGNELPADRAFSLGGPQSFPGYSEGEVRAREYWVVYGNFLYPLANLVPLKSETLYGGMGLEIGEVRERVDPVPSGYLYGISAYFGGRTPLGTVTFGLGAASHSWALWLTLGRPVGQGTILNEPLFR